MSEQRKRVGWIWAATLGMALAGGLWAAEPAAKPVSEAARVQELLRELRKPKLTDEQRQQTVDGLLESEEGAKLLEVQLARDLVDKRRAYGAAFEKAAADLLRSRWKPQTEMEVRGLRQQVQAVAKNPDKESITGKSDPAMEKLAGLLSVEPKQVLESEKLSAQRKALEELAGTCARAWERIGEEKRKKMTAPPTAEAFAKDLEAWEQVAAAMAMPMSPMDRQVMMGNVEVGRQLDPEEAAGIFEANLIRLRAGLNAAAIDPRLCAAGRDHSKDMQEKDFFAHESPVPGKKLPWDRAKNFGTSADAENIAMGAQTGKDATMMWWHSPGHHKNMMAVHKRIGLGRTGVHWTQMFGD